MRRADLEAAWEKRVVRLGEFIEAVGTLAPLGVPEGAQLTGFSVRLPGGSKPEALIVVRASDGEQKWVAFVGGLDLAQALLTWRAKVQAGGMKWREDAPWPGGS